MDDDFILRNVGLVHLVARRMYASNIDPSADYKDFYSEGVLGLICAAKRFDANAGYKFSSFAAKYIMGYIQRRYSGSHNVLRYPDYIVKLARKIFLADQQLLKAAELSKLYGVSVYYANLALEYINLSGRFSLGEKVGDEEATQLDMVGFDDDPTALEVSDFIDTLPASRKDVLQLLLDGYSQSDIAKKMGVSRQRVSIVKLEIAKAWQSWSENER